MNERLILVGMMGAGKSSVARIVAARLGWRVVDTDTEVERIAGKSVSDIFDERGEEGFRNVERGVVRDVTAGETEIVISMGGGAVLSSANRKILKSGGTVVWLRASPSTLSDHIGLSSGRPLLEGAREELQSDEERRAKIAAIDSMRRHMYEEVADVIIDVDHRSVEEIADLVVASCGVGE